MSEIALYGGPYDGRVEVLKDFYMVDGKLRPREGWPLMLEFRVYTGDKPAMEAVGQEAPISEGRLLARYRLTERITPEGHQVYEHVPD